MKLFKARPTSCWRTDVNAINAMYPSSRAWPFNDKCIMVYLKIPKTLDLHKDQKRQQSLNGGSLNIANLPTELLNMILDYAGVIDRICLAITCKCLAAQFVASPHLKFSAWTPWYDYNVDISPVKCELLRRLAHGWVDKKDFRYCCRCHKILTRSPEYFWSRLNKREKLNYDLKVDMERPRWKALSRKKQYEHIIQNWCDAAYEDNSVFSCLPCRTQFAHGETRNGDLEKGTTTVVGELQWKLPVECPLCIEHGLTHVYKPPRKKVFRPLLLRMLKWVVSFIGNVLLITIYLIYLLFKAPFDCTRWCWRKSRSWRTSLKKPKILTCSWFKAKIAATNGVPG